MKSALSDIVDDKEKQDVLNSFKARMQAPPGQSFAPFMFNPAEMTFKQDLHMQSGKN